MSYQELPDQRQAFTTGQCLAYAAVIEATRGATVARLLDTGEVVTGIGRAITDQHGQSAARLDIRDAYLRVTGGLTEYFWPLCELASEYRDGTFSPDYPQR